MNCDTVPSWPAQTIHAGCHTTGNVQYTRAYLYLCPRNHRPRRVVEAPRALIIAPATAGSTAGAPASRSTARAATAADLAELVEGDQGAAAARCFFSHLRFSNGIVRKNASAPAIRESIAGIVSGDLPTLTILLYADGVLEDMRARRATEHDVHVARRRGKRWRR